MSKGQYVRAPIELDSDDSSTEDTVPEPLAFETVESNGHEDPRKIHNDHTKESNDSGRMDRLERAFVDLTQAILDQHRGAQDRASSQTSRSNDNSWFVPETADLNREPTLNIRWDHIKPFPSNVPAREMWGTWQKYLETFEIAASFSNANDPMRRTQLLFLAMGESLQTIVRAAGLRPNLKDPLCYNSFVRNIGEYLRTKTDSSAEHEAFLMMHQAKGESIVCYHARLMEKVRSCGYHLDDQNRFVRTQLLKGMTNQELARTARTYGHDTGVILQAATRNESYEKADEERPAESEVFAVNRIVYPAGANRKRAYRGSNHVDQHSTEATQGRSNLCYRCNRTAHPDPRSCPAKTRRCNVCKMKGHFAAACRKRSISSVKSASFQPEPNQNSPKQSPKRPFEEKV